MREIREKLTSWRFFKGFEVFPPWGDPYGQPGPPDHPRSLFGQVFISGTSLRPIGPIGQLFDWLDWFVAWVNKPNAPLHVVHAAHWSMSAHDNFKLNKHYIRGEARTVSMRFIATGPKVSFEWSQLLVKVHVPVATHSIPNLRVKRYSFFLIFDI